MLLRSALCVALSASLAGTCLAVDVATSQVDQARQFGTTYRPQENAAAPNPPSSAPPAFIDPEDDSFGSAQILKRVEKPPTFDLFGDVSAFYTNNVALTNRHTFGDAFLVGNFGLSAARKISETVELDYTVKAGIFRYNKFSEFDLDTVDIGGGISYRLPKLWDSAVYLQYDFTELFNGENNTEFFRNHAVTIGMQKAFAMSRAQSLTMGLSATFNFSEPRISQRDEYGLYLGYHVDFTSRFSADLFYRYAYQVYAEGDRGDHNQTLTLSLRYAVNSWFSIIGSTYFTFNRSNDQAYNYDALAEGLGLSANIRF